jgi:1,4-alpha-glucan branching enzyme
MTKAKKKSIAVKATKTKVLKTNKKKPIKKAEGAKNIGIQKKYVKTKKTCKVTFTMPKIAAPDSKSVCIVGDFNNWNIYANPLKKLKNGNYSITLELESGKEYQFRYLIDECKWENDWNADKYVRSHYGDSDNSVIII